MRYPKTAYVPLWFPLPSETFIFREFLNLRELGMDMAGYSIYGPAKKRLSPQMRDLQPEVKTLGIRALGEILSNLMYWKKRDSKTTAQLWKTIPLRRWSYLEAAGENLWCFAAGFTLARYFEEDGIEHIHSPWANGPATAAWVASTLTGIPFSFSARAGDIYPPDGALTEKMRAARFIRVNNAANIKHLTQVAPDCRDKIHLVYNSLTLAEREPARLEMKPPYKLLALGRFARTKGYDYLLMACKNLKERGFPFTLTLAGSGFQEAKLKRLWKSLELTDVVNFPGYVTHDKVTQLMLDHDVFIMPSIIHKTGDRDGIPNVIMEALSHRLPVIATSISGIPEVIENNVTGLLRPEKNPAALAEAVRAMCADPDRARAMAKAGQARVLSMFDTATNTKQLAELYSNQVFGPTAS